MTYFGIIGFVFALVAYSEVLSLKKRVAALEAARGGPGQ
jgi:hypothetical protein